jgi:hypothetical protein
MPALVCSMPMPSYGKLSQWSECSVDVLCGLKCRMVGSRVDVTSMAPSSAYTEMQNFWNGFIFKNSFCPDSHSLLLLFSSILKRLAGTESSAMCAVT